MIPSLESASPSRTSAGTRAGDASRSEARQAGSDGGAAAALGNNADFASLVPTEELTDVHSVLPPPGTVKAWFLRSVGRELLHRHGVKRRMGGCGYRVSRGQDGVNVYRRPDRAYGRVSGVCVCGQSVCCPVCAPRIAAFRGAEVSEAYMRAQARGWEARLETFTAPHQLDLRPDALLRQFREFSDLWRSYGSGARAMRRDSGARGHHLAREVTWGTNGWHYHHHRLRYDAPGTFQSELSRADWLAVLERRGLRTPGADEHAYDCSEVTSEVGARYVAKLSSAVEAQANARIAPRKPDENANAYAMRRAKIAAELTGASNKGRNLNSLLLDFVRGDLNAGAVWVNGVAAITATKVSSVRWSRGLRAELGLEREKSDEQVAAEEVLPTDEFLGSLNHQQWRHIVALKAEFALLCAAQRGREAVDEMLSGLGLGVLDEDDPYAAWSAEKRNKPGVVLQN